MADDAADDTNYKLIRAVDPTKIKVPIKSRFAKLTLSAKTKNIPAEVERVTKVEQNLNQSESITPNVMDKIYEMPTESSSSFFENPLCCSESTTHGSAFYWQQADTEKNTQINVDELQDIQTQTEGEGMEPLQVSDDFTSPRNISSTQTTTKHETSLCITISDTISDYMDSITEPEPAISGYHPDVHDVTIKPPTSANILGDDKISRINAFLRDVSLERKECAQHDRYIEPELERQLAQADTESMSHTTGIMSQFVPIDYKSPTQKNVQHITNGINLIEIDDGKSEVNKSNAEFHSFSSKESSSANRTFNSIADESITVPETSSEVELHNDSQCSKKTDSGGISSPVGTTDTNTTSVVPLHLNSINISAKFNIKIHISNAEIATSNSSMSSNGTSDDTNTKTNDISTSQQQKSKLDVDSDSEEIVDQSSDVEEENFIVHAEELLNELYGNSWQTPNVIKSLKRTSRSGQKNPKTVSRTTRPEKITPKTQATKKSTAVKNESVLDDFSIFRSKIVNGNMDSTHLKTPTTVQPKKNRLDNIRNENRFRGTQSENRNPKLQENWRQLIDEDSDSDIESDNEKDCKDDTISIASTISGISSNSHTSSEVEEILSTKKRLEEEQQGRTPLENILRTCRSENKPKLESTRKNDIKTKRKLFVPYTGYEDEEAAEEIIKNARSVSDDLLDDLENVYMPGTPVYKRVQEIKRQISGGDSGKKSESKPIFKLPTTVKTPAIKSSKTKTRLLDKFEEKNTTPNRKYSFLKSLEECVSKSLCDPKALIFRDNYRTKKDELAQELYAMFIKKLFNEAFNVPIIWNKKLTTTAGRCLNKKRLGSRSSVIELSDKVLTSAERLRCTLIHELCHAATWILNEESGHGATWKNWAARANQTFPELPKIGICHNYEIEYKYTYQCTQCLAKSHAHSKSKKVENIRCSYCHGDIELFRNKKDKDGNIIATQIKEATGFAKFVKEHYKRFKRPDLKHADVMKILSNEFGNMKVSSNSN